MQSLIALGGNEGDVAGTFQSALCALDASPAIEVRRVSSHYLTPPMGSAAGGPFLNAAAELETSLSPVELLEALQSVEAEHDRRRSMHWGPRTLDLDLLLYGDRVIEESRLTLPHPGCWYRRFVLDPLAEIAPDLVHPVKGATIKELQGRLLERPLKVGISGKSGLEREGLAAAVSESFPGVAADDWTPHEANPPTLLLWIGTDQEQGVAFEDLPLLPRLDLTRFPEEPRAAARHVLTAALGPCDQTNGVL